MARSDMTDPTDQPDGERTAAGWLGRFLEDFEPGVVALGEVVYGPRPLDQVQAKLTKRAR